jgi:hypothetical protein
VARTAHFGKYHVRPIAPNAPLEVVMERWRVVRFYNFFIGADAVFMPLLYAAE